MNNKHPLKDRPKSLHHRASIAASMKLAKKYGADAKDTHTKEWQIEYNVALERLKLEERLAAYRTGKVKLAKV